MRKTNGDLTVSVSETHKVRPAGRHILTIGSDLIKDPYAAVIELVKNSYDADSPDVIIEFNMLENLSYTITISDHGHGMTKETVINKWMVPSTDDKQTRRMSPAGRTMQGRKGIGRYAASLLGKDLRLETITPDGEKTVAFIEWARFEKAQYLDEVEILIETSNTNMPSGTKITISGDITHNFAWDEDQFKNLRFELKKLMAPTSIAVDSNFTQDRFDITLTIKNQFPEPTETTEPIEPYPIQDLFDYRISGNISADGKGSLSYTTQKSRNAVTEEIKFDLKSPTNCGEISFDIRVYDRDKEAIEALIGRGLKDEYGQYVGKNQARSLLNSLNGIGVYRNGFRIRPLGDADFDWLKLNKRRVQDPSKRIGSDQVIGYVQIQSEELSGLTEKSARDGLKENDAFKQLKNITEKVISELESRRFAYRKNTGLNRPALKVERELEQLFSFDEMKRNISTKLSKGGIDTKTTEEIINIIDKDAENKNKVADEIRQAVAIYQGQATLGKIINVILHEGRRPLNYFKNQIPNLQYWHNQLSETKDPGILEKIIPMTDGIGQNADIFAKLFGRLDPLAAGKRPPKKSITLKKTIGKVFSVFDHELELHHISHHITGPDEFRFPSWDQDIYAIFTNLIDNSIYWISEKKTLKREINIDIETKGDSLLYIDYRDTGPGIEPYLISSEAIFEPQFTTKPNGTGLGLAIAGEAAARNGLELKAFETDGGAYFRLQPKTEMAL
ncbi:MAG TPA: ATP-binding protein [Rhodospirillaceae bacterium]|nr:ATP-binding protein [Rhodospirillaceae bacterium]